MANGSNGMQTVSPAKALREIAEAVPERCRDKDLGRVLALARLAVACDEDALLAWPAIWLAALKDRFPDEWRELAGRASKGLRALLASEPDLEQALHTCVNGLLASNPPTLALLRIAGQRLLLDAIEPLEMEAVLGA